MSSLNSHPFISSDDLLRYQKNKIIRNVTQSGSENNDQWKMDSLVTMLTKGVFKSNYNKILQIKDAFQRQKELHKAEEELRRVKNLPLRKGLNIFCIKTMAQDGMSWSAQMVFDSATNSLDMKRKEEEGYKMFVLKATREKLSNPQIANLIGIGKFNSLSFKAGVRKKMWIIKNLKLLLRAIVVLVGGVLGNLVFELLKSDDPKALKGGRILFIVAASVAGILSYYLLDKHLNLDGGDAKTKSSEGWDANIGDPGYSDKYEKLRNLVAASLYELSGISKMVILDNYELLDDFSKEVLVYYFDNYNSFYKANGVSDYWLVFEPQHGDQLSFAIKNPDSNSELRFIRYFEQVTLTKHEKKILVDFYKLKDVDTRINNTTVISVVHDLKAYKWIENSLQTFLSREQDHFDLDFLILLSLTTTLRNVELDRENLRQIFGLEKIQRSLLKFFFYGTTEGIWGDNVVAMMERLEKSSYFSKMILKIEKGKTVSWQIMSEVAQIVADTPNLRIKVSLGHAFWAIHWYEKRSTTNIQAVWIKKMVYHLHEFDFRKGLYTYPDQQTKLEPKDNIIRKILEVYQYTIEGCLRTCLVSYRIINKDNSPTAILRLAEKMVDIISESEIPITKKELFDKLELLWEVYFISQEPDMLALIAQLNKKIAPAPGVDHLLNEDLNSLEKVFYDSLALPGNVKRNLKPNLSREHNFNPLTKMMPVYQFMQVQTIWLTYIVQPSLVHVPKSFYLDTGKEWNKQVSINYKNVAARIKNTNKYENSLIDFMYLSEAIWVDSIAADFFVITLEGATKYFDKLEATLDLITYVRKSRQLSRPASGEYFIHSTLIEIAVTSLAGICIYTSYAINNVPGFIGNTVSMERLNGILSKIDFFLESGIAPITQVQDLFTELTISKIDGYLEFSSMIWKRFQMDQSYNMVVVKRIHYNAIFMANQQNKQFYLSRIIGTTINENVTSRLFINLSKVIYKKSSTELRAKLISDTNRLLQNSDYHFGKILKEEISMSSFINSTDNTEYMKDLTAAIIKGTDPENTVLFKLFRDSSEDMLESKLNMVMNVVGSLQSPDLEKRSLSVINEFISQLANNDLRSLLADQLRFYEWKSSVYAEKKIDIEHALNYWKHYKDRWYYPHIILTCFNLSPGDLMLEEESLEVMSSKYESTRYNSRLKLATMYLEHALETNRDNNPHFDNNIKMAIDCLSNSVDKFTEVNSSTSNIAGYKLLARFDSDNEEYYNSQVKKWEEVKKEVSLLSNLIFNLNKRRFCLIFVNIVKQMFHYGLELRSQPRGSSASALSAVIEIDECLWVNKTFYTECVRALNEESETVPIYKLNEIAMENLAPLIDICFDLKGLPRPIKTLLNEYRDQIDEFIIPVEALDVEV